MRNVLLKLDDDELADIDAAFQKAREAWGTLAKMISAGADSPAAPYMGHLLRDSDKTAHKINALIGVGIAFADLLGKRDNEKRTQMVVRMTAHNVWPELILPAASSRLNGMPLNDFLALVDDNGPDREQ